MPPFLVDEDLPRSTARLLRESGFEAHDIRDLGLRGHSDQEIFEHAQRLGAVLVTGDLDFANSLRFPPRSHAGILVSRLPDEMSTQALNQELLRALKQIRPGEISGFIAVVEPGRVRIRR